MAALNSWGWSAPLMWEQVGSVAPSSGHLFRKRYQVNVPLCAQHIQQTLSTVRASGHVIHPSEQHKSG